MVSREATKSYNKIVIDQHHQPNEKEAIALSAENTRNSFSHYVRKQVAELNPGDIVLHPVYRSDGLLLVSQHKELNNSLIARLQQHSLANSQLLISPSLAQFRLFIRNKEASGTAFQEDLRQLVQEFSRSTNNRVQLSAFNNDSSAFFASDDSEHLIVTLLQNYPYWELIERRLESDHLREKATVVKNRILSGISADHFIKELVIQIKRYDDVLFIHSINSTCISLLIGLTLECSADDLVDLAYAALFMNVGYLNVPNEQFHDYLRTHDVNHPAMKTHLFEFPRRLTTDRLQKESILTAIADHHEFYNGTGLPNKKKGEKISLFGRVLHIAHKYDSLVGGYKYTNGVLPFEGLKYIADNRGIAFDPDIISAFLHRTTYFKVGEVINLPSRQRGKIIGFRNYVKYPYLPIVKLEDSTTLDLSAGR